MRNLLIAGVVLWLAACEKDEVAKVVSEQSLVDEAVALMRQHRDKICACKTNACSDSAFEAYSASAKESLERLDRAQVKADQAQGSQMKAIATSIGICVKNLRTPQR